MFKKMCSLFLAFAMGMGICVLHETAWAQENLTLEIMGESVLYKPEKGKATVLRYTLWEDTCLVDGKFSLEGNPVDASIGDNGILLLHSDFSGTSLVIKASYQDKSVSKTVSVKEALFGGFTGVKAGDDLGGNWANQTQKLAQDGDILYANGQGWGGKNDQRWFPGRVVTGGTFSIEYKFRIPSSVSGGYISAFLTSADAGNQFLGPSFNVAGGKANLEQSGKYIPCDKWMNAKGYLDIDRQTYSLCVGEQEPTEVVFDGELNAKDKKFDFRFLLFGMQVYDLSVCSGKVQCIENLAGIMESEYGFSNASKVVSGVTAHTDAQTFLSKISFFPGYSGKLIGPGGQDAAYAVQGCKLQVVGSSGASEYEIFFRNLYDVSFDDWSGNQLYLNKNISQVGGNPGAKDGLKWYIPGTEAPLTEDAPPSAFMQAIEDVEKGSRVFRMYSKAQTLNSNSERHMYITNPAPLTDQLGNSFAMELSLKTDNISALTSLIGITPEKVWLRPAELSSSGRITVFGEDTGKEFPLNQWMHLMILVDKAEKTNSVQAFLDGDLIYRGTPKQLQNLTYFENIRIQHQFSNGTERNSWVDDFKVYPMMNLGTFDAGAVKTKLSSSSLRISNSIISEYGSSTVEQVIAELIVPDGAKISVLDNVQIEEMARPGIRFLVTARDGIHTWIYTLGKAEADISELRVFLDGASVEGLYFAPGRLSAEYEITYEKTKFPAVLVMAQYKDGVLVKIGKTEKMIQGTDKIRCDLDIEEPGGTVKVLLLHSMEDLRPLTSAAELTPYTKGQMTVDKEFYPGHVRKALTFSYDDYNYDDKLLGILNANGLKGTFNLNSLTHYPATDGNSDKAKDKTYLKQLYAGHEINNHVKGHKLDGDMTYEAGIAAIDTGKAELEAVFDTQVKGFCYPNTYPVKWDQIGRIDQYLAENYEYARPTHSSYSFELPRNFMFWEATTKHDNLAVYGEQFLNLEDDGKLKLFYVWGHSWELEAGQAGGWKAFEKFAQQAGAREDIWKATNLQICEYVKAQRDVVITENSVSNPSKTITVYVKVNGRKIALKPGQIFTVDEL